MFWCSRTSPLPLPRLQHLPSPSSRTPPLSLSFISNTRTSPHGLVLMFGHPSPSRPPERAHTGSFWCSRTSSLSLPRLEHPFPSRPPERAHTGSFWCSCTSPLSLPHLKPPLSLSLIYLPF